MFLAVHISDDIEAKMKLSKDSQRNMPTSTGSMQNASITLYIGLRLCRFAHMHVCLYPQLYICIFTCTCTYSILYAKCQGCAKCDMCIFTYNPHRKPTRQMFVSFSDFKEQGLKKTLFQSHWWESDKHECQLHFI